MQILSVLIVVEVKSFVGRSIVKDLEQTLSQYVNLCRDC
jgi:hypothetical protein